MPCLWFDTQAEEAASLYTSIFEDARIVEVTRYGSGGPRPEGMVMTVIFDLGGQRFMALNGGPRVRLHRGRFLCRHVRGPGRGRPGLGHPDRRGEEGPCGWCKDRFGLSWQVVPAALPELIGDPDPQRSRGAMDAILAMSKLDIERLRRGADDAVAAAGP